MKMVKIGDFLTDSDVAAAIKLYNKYKNTPELVEQIEDHIIRPNLARINKTLGQENDSKYLAYVVEYAMMEVSRKKGLK